MDIIRQSLALTFVFALLWAALWFLRRKNMIGIGFPKARAQRGLLESRGRLALGAQHSVHLVRIGERSLVLGVHPSGITLLSELPRGPDDSHPMPGEP